MVNEIKNLGVIPGPQKRPTDFVAGTLPYEIRMANGDWTEYLPLGEWQWKDGQETMACVSFSLNNAVETQEYFLTGNRVNYSDRWLAMMSGTTHDGNYLYLVADTIRKYGLVAESSWPAPVSFDWNSYYAKPNPTQMAALQAEGKKWLETHEFAYEWLTTSLADLQKHLKQCPLQVVIPGHAVMDFYTPSQVVNYFDSYSPFKKQTQRSELTDVLKPVLTMKEYMVKRYKVDKNGKLGVLVSVDGAGIFTDTVIWAKSELHYLELLKQYEIPTDAPIIKYP